MITEITEKDFLKLKIKMYEKQGLSNRWTKLDVVCALGEARQSVDDKGLVPVVAVFQADKTDPYVEGITSEKTTIIVPGVKHIYQKRNWYEVPFFVSKDSGKSVGKLSIPRRTNNDKIYLVHLGEE